MTTGALAADAPEAAAAAPLAGGLAAEGRSDTDGATGAAGPAGPHRHRLGLHVLVYALLLVGLLAGSRLNASWSADDGAYATQVRLASAGDWAYPYAHADIDPTGRNVPLGNSDFDAEGRVYTYVKLPVWILVLQASSRLFGHVVGLYVPSALGAIAAAVVAWKLAERLGGRGAIGFWAVAAGPLLIHSSAMWAHTVSAALGGLVALGVVAIASGRDRWWHIAGLGATLAALCLLRTEGVLLTVATTAVLVLVLALRPGPLHRRALAVVAKAGLPAAAAVVAWRLNASLIVWLSGATTPWRPHPLSMIPTTFVEARVFGFVRTFVVGPGSTLPAVLAVVGVLLVGLAGRAWRRSEPGRTEPIVLAVGGILLMVPRFVVGWSDLVGLLPAAPLLLFGLPLWRRRRDNDPAGPVMAISGLYILAVVATQYAEGGGREWGGRYTFLAIVPLSVIAALAVQRQVRRVVPASSQRAVLAGLALVLLVVPSAFGVRDTWLLREQRFHASEEMAHAPTKVVIALDAPLPRLGWRYLPGRDWLYSRRDDLPRLLAALRAQDTGAVTLVGDGADAISARGYTRRVASPTELVLTPVG